MGSHNLRIVRRHGVFLGSQQFFVEFLAGSQTDFLDFNVVLTGKLDHFLGQVVNLDGLTHVKNENFIVLSDGTGFHHQAASLGNGHEEAYDALVGHRQRSALFELLTEKRNH